MTSHQTDEVSGLTRLSARGLGRRSFLALLALAAVGMSCDGRRWPGTGGPRIGLALGGGGARGLAHVAVLELLDELQLRPHHIAGTSIGAVMGALYAAGLTGREIRDLFDRLVIRDTDSWREILDHKELYRWFQFFDPELGSGGLVDGESFVRFLGDVIGKRSFRELNIPLTVVAADLWTGEQVLFDSGDLLVAIKASTALPGLFSPVRHGARVLVDGGVVNPVPYDLLEAECDLVIAVDVMGQRLRDTDGAPSMLDAIFSSFQNMQKTILDQKLRQKRPDVYIRPDIRGIRVLDFFKADDIYRMAEPALKQARSRLRALVPARESA